LSNPQLEQSDIRAVRDFAVRLPRHRSAYLQTLAGSRRAAARTLHGNRRRPTGRERQPDRAARWRCAGGLSSRPPDWLAPYWSRSTPKWG